MKTLKGFEDVNAELVEIRDLEKQAEAKQARANAAIEKIENKLTEETNAWYAEIAKRKEAIAKFCVAHFNEFGGKSKKFDAGTVLFRETDELVIADEAKTLQALAKHYPDGFAVKHSIDRIALKKLGLSDLKKIGVERFVRSACVIQTKK